VGGCHLDNRALDGWLFADIEREQAITFSHAVTIGGANIDTGTGIDANTQASRYPGTIRHR